MTDEQITGELSHARRIVAVLMGACGLFVLSNLLPGPRFWLGLLAVAAISYLVYIATIIRVWNAHYRVGRDRRTTIAEEVQ